MARTSKSITKRRVAIVAGLRTPFVKASTVFKHLTALDMGKLLVAELVGRSNLDPGTLDRIVFGQVVQNPEAPNIAREIGLGAGLPTKIDAYTVSRACATGTQAMVDGALAILNGDIDVAICGGADSLSRPPVTYRDRFVDALMDANMAKDPIAKARAFFDLKPSDFLPKAPALKEISTGLTMGESAEVMAKENNIDRESQDALAYQSHQRAALAWEKGIFDAEVMHFGVPPKFDPIVTKDGIVRPDTSLEKLRTLKPVFDKMYGTITAGNSSPLTDGAAAVILMEESRAKELGFEPLAFMRSWAFAGIDPHWQLLMGPVFAAPLALDRAGLTLADMTYVDMHEAFAAQVLSNRQALASADFARKYLDRKEPVGEISDAQLNIYGGSISLGHPFAATGARQALTMAHELKRRGGGMALITQCAAGGLGAALILER